MNNYKEMPLKLYEQLEAVLDTDSKDIDKTIAVVSIMEGITEDEVLNLPINEFSRLTSKYAWMAEEPVSVGVKESYNIGEFTLKPLVKHNQISTAQFIDFQNFAEAGDTRGMLTTMLIPEGHRYNDGYDMDALRDAISTMSVADVVSVRNFLLASLAESQLCFLRYSGHSWLMMLKIWMAKIQLKTLVRLAKCGGGSVSLTLCRKLQNLTGKE